MTDPEPRSRAPGVTRGAATPLHERPRPAETDLELARRHVREATDRLERQQALIAVRIERFDEPRMIQLSVELLETLRMTVKVALQHLRTVESMRGVASDPARRCAGARGRCFRVNETGGRYVHP